MTRCRELGRIGAWTKELRLGDSAAAPDAAAELEDMGYSALWLPGGPDLFDSAAALLEATKHVVVATGIVSVWRYEAPVTAHRHAALARSHPGRFVLGLGTSHSVYVDRD